MVLWSRASLQARSAHENGPKSAHRRGNVNGKCDGSNLRVKPSDSCPFMDLSKTSSASDDTCCKRVITDSFEVAHSSLGTQ